MKQSQIHVLAGSTVYGSMLVVMSVVVLFITACHLEEKQQRTPIQAKDTLQKDPPSKQAWVTKEVFPGGDSFQQGCQFIQGQAESLLEEYHRSRPTVARARQILIKLSKLEME